MILGISIFLSNPVGKLLSPHTLKSLNNIEKIQPGMMRDTFKNHPCTTIITWYSFTNISDQADITTFHN